MTGLWPVVVSALCAGGCAASLLAPHPRRLLLGRGLAAAPSRGGHQHRSAARTTRQALTVAGIAASAPVAAIGTGSLALTVLVPVVAAVLLRTRRERCREAQHEHVRSAVLDLCAALAAELRAGVPAPDALERASEVPGAGTAVAPRALRAARSGEDVAQALRWDAGSGGAEGLRALGACWEVAMGSGAAMSPALSRLVRGMRAEQAHRREVAATLAGPRATARLLALLPAAGLLMGTGLGVDPVGLLLTTPVGSLLLVAGAGLALLGLAWTERLARGADLAASPSRSAPSA